MQREKHLAPVLVKLSRKTPYLPAGHRRMFKQTHSSAAPEPLAPVLSRAPGASPFTPHRLTATALSPGCGHPLSLPQAVQEGSAQHPLGLGHRGVLALQQPGDRSQPHAGPTTPRASQWHRRAPGNVFSPAQPVPSIPTGRPCGSPVKMASPQLDIPPVSSADIAITPTLPFAFLIGAAGQTNPALYIGSSARAAGTFDASPLAPVRLDAKSHDEAAPAPRLGGPGPMPPLQVSAGVVWVVGMLLGWAQGPPQGMKWGELGSKGIMEGSRLGWRTAGWSRSQEGLQERAQSEGTAQPPARPCPELSLIHI